MTIKNKLELEAFVCTKWNEINEYLDSKLSDLPAPLYSSVDIRESKDKVAPVDCNIYPAGFNNLCQLDLDASVNRFRKVIEKIDPKIKRIAILPESNTKNTFYLDHLAILGRTLSQADYEVSFVSFDENLFEDKSELNLVSHSNFEIRLQKLTLKEDKLFDNDGELDLIILNNDQSKIIEIDWNGIKTPITPTPHIGWFQRQKNKHFEFYDKVTQEFCKHFDIDQSLIQAQYKTIDDVDFATKDGLEQLAREVDSLKANINENSNIFIKASQGTYGMGISVVQSGEEVINMNRKTRNKMDVGKNKIKFTSVLIQEGIETVIKYDDNPAEVTIYLVDGCSAGGFIRANSQKSATANLNSRGMIFSKFCISEIRQNQEHKCKEALYSVVGRLSTLASAYEIQEVLN